MPTDPLNTDGKCGRHRGWNRAIMYCAACAVAVAFVALGKGSTESYAYAMLIMGGAYGADKLTQKDK